MVGAAIAPLYKSGYGCADKWCGMGEPVAEEEALGSDAPEAEEKVWKSGV